MYIRPLRTKVPPIIGKDRLERFIDEVFHNFDELLQHHKKLVEAFHEIQREEHPVIRSVTDPMMDAALNFREAYMEYIPNYPIAAYRIDDEMANNQAFREFVEVCARALCRCQVLMLPSLPFSNKRDTQMPTDWT
jgi:hypothetical protein